MISFLSRKTVSKSIEWKYGLIYFSATRVKSKILVRIRVNQWQDSTWVFDSDCDKVIQLPQKEMLSNCYWCYLMQNNEQYDVSVLSCCNNEILPNPKTCHLLFMMYCLHYLWLFTLLNIGVNYRLYSTWSSLVRITLCILLSIWKGCTIKLYFA